MPPTIDTVFQCAGTLCVLDESTNVYDPMDKTAIGQSLLTIERAPTIFKIVVKTLGEVDTEQLIHPSLAMQYHFPTGSVFWEACVDGHWLNLGFRFVVSDKKLLSAEMAAQTFVLKYNICVYELLTGTTVKVDSEDIDYLAKAGTSEKNRDGNAEEEVFSLDDAGTISTGPKSTNTCFAESVIYQRALVVQKSGSSNDNVIQAYAFDNRSGITANGMEEMRLPTLTGTVSEALLNHSEQQLYVVETRDSSLDGALRQLDLEHGQIVQTFSCGGDDSKWVKSVKPYAKYASVEPNLLSCIGSNSAFAIDTRLDPRKCVVMSEDSAIGDLRYSSVKGANCFTAHATSKNGFLVVGDRAGDVRLYTGPPGARKANGSDHHSKLAKTLINLKSPVLALDITSDGTLIIATTKDRILVLDTRFVDDAGTTKCGFETRMGKRKPAPLALLPSPPQVVKMGGTDKVAFTKATLESDTQNPNEQWISAACGSFICMWSMKQVRAAVENHRNVYCSGKDVKVPLVGIDVPISSANNGRAAVCLLHPHGVSVQLQSESSSEKKPRNTSRFSFFDE